ncbi:protein tyrosine phosphatase [Acidovorax temperans]
MTETALSRGSLCGNKPQCTQKVSIEDVRWASVILVMEEKLKSRLIAEITRLLENKPVHVLGIPDEYKYMGPELIEMLEQSVNSLLGLPHC